MKSKKFIAVVIVSLFCLMFLGTIEMVPAQPIPTAGPCDFYGLSTTLDGAPVPIGAVIDAYDPGGVLCGTYTVTNVGWYGFMAVYGDDTTTPVDEGAEAGDIISFKINGIDASVVSGDPTWAAGEQKQVELEAFAPCQADFLGIPTSGCAPLTVNFTDQSSGDINSWSWDFGDGNTSVAQNPSHTYANPGTYTVMLNVVGNCGSDTETKTDYITVPAPPQAAFSGNPTSGCAPLTVDFTDLSTGDVDLWSWNFGDGGTSTAQNPSHIYANAGTYTVNLIASGPCGSDHETKVDYITVSAAPQADFSGTPTSGCAPLTVNFTDQSTGNITGWSWNFGDGGTSTAQNPSHIYANAGTYTVSLTVTGPCGSDTETKVHYITVWAAPQADFSGTPTSGCTPLTVGFTDLSTGDITGWSWNFGDGGTSTAQNPSHTYTNPGTYTVSLTVTGPCGSDTESKVDYISVSAPPQADFSGTPTSGPAALTVNFTDLCTGDITSWSWNFGDGGTSTVQNPSHAYANTGTYTVSLTVTGPCGSDTETKVDYITVTAPAPPPPVPLFGPISATLLVILMALAAIIYLRRRTRTAH